MFAPAAFLNGVKPVTLPLREFRKFCTLAPNGCPALAAISDPV